MVKLIAVIDNYDSFTFNLVQAFGGLGAELRVFRNDAVAPGELISGEFAALVVSPGPCTPARSGISVEAIRAAAGKLPVLGVCLGCQAMAEAFGGKVVPAPRLMHGKTSPVFHDSLGLFRGIENPFQAMRYHSLIVDEKTLPGCFVKTARTDRDELMGFSHRELPLYAVQFHPESFMTPAGTTLLNNFLELSTTGVLQ